MHPQSPQGPKHHTASQSLVEGSFCVSFSKMEVGPSAPQNGLQSTIFVAARLCVNVEFKSKERRCKVGLSSVSAVEGTFFQFLSQEELFSSFCHKTDFSAMQQNFLLCNKASCCAVKLPAVH